MNPQDIYVEFNWTAENPEEKETQLTNFFQNNEVEYMENGIPRFRNKFLFLYGEDNTGKLTFLNRVAQNVIGDNWESKVYIRKDEGQRFPYKLHAHKVENSVKIIFVTSSRVHWHKWKELYPITKAMEFRGAEIQNNLDANGFAIYTIGSNELIQNRRNTREQELQHIEEIVRSHNGDPNELRNKLLQFHTSLNVNFSLAFMNSQVALI